MSCAQPIDVAVLADYWLGALSGPEEEVVEEHLLGCDACGARLRDLIALAEGIRAVAREGSLWMVVNDGFVQQAAKEGLRVREYAPLPGGAVQCTVGAEDDVLLGRLAVDLSTARQVDLCVCDEHGVERDRLRDIPFHRGPGQVIFQPPLPLMKAAPSFTLVARLVGVDDSGHERLLGEYTFNHTRSFPGPGTW